MTPVEINTCNRPNDNHEKDKDKHSSFTTFLLVVIFAALPTMVANYGIYKKKIQQMQTAELTLGLAYIASHYC